MPFRYPQLYLILLGMLSGQVLSGQAQTTALPQEVVLAKSYARLADSLYLYPDTSLHYAQLALHIFEQFDMPAEQVDVRNGLSAIYAALGDHYAMEKNNRLAYDIARSSLPLRHPLRIKATNNYSIIFSRIKQDYHTALDLLEEAYQQLEDDEDLNLRGGILYNIGGKYFTLGDFHTAATFYRKAVESYEQDPQRLYSRVAEASIEYSRASAALQDYETAAIAGRKALLIADTASLRVSSSSYARDRFQSYQSQFILLATTKEFYNNALDLIYRLYQNAPSERWAREAYFFIEKSKSTLLLNELKRKAIAGQLDLPDAYVERTYAIGKQLVYNRQLLERLPGEDFTKRREIESTILDLEFKQKLLEDSIRVHFPVFRQLSQHRPISLDSLRSQQLTPEDLLINMFLGKEWLYALGIDNERLTFIRRPAALFSVEKVDAFLDQLKLDTQEKFAGFRKQAEAWHQALFAPFPELEEKHNIILIPDGVLARVPFACLLSDGKGHSPGNLSYLILRYNIHYAYSAGVMAFHRSSPQEPQRVLGVYPLFSGSDRYQADVAAQLPYLRRLSGKQLVGDQADKSVFQQLAPAYGILFFATHARASDQQYQEPAIDFFDTPLYLSELSQMQLQAQLAILSACETGTGQIRPGEGTLSLARGFTYAGVPALLTTFWSVPEGSTMDIVTTFTDLVDPELPVDAALRQAQLQYLQKPGLSQAERAPYYWAGMVTLGKRTKLSIGKTRKYQYMIAGAAVLLLLLAGKFLKNPVPFISRLQPKTAGDQA